MKKTNKISKGFTLIELIVVISILAIIVLLAFPRFLGQTEKVQEARIKNDIRVTEEQVQIHFMNNLDEWADTSLNPEEMSEDGDFYSKRGKVENMNQQSLAKIPYSFLSENVGSTLNGTFYLDENQKVFYYVNHLAGDSGEEIETPSYYVLASDTDFTRNSLELEDLDGNESTVYFWQYIGSDDYVIIPNIINGENVDSYFGMFLGSNVKGIASSEESNINDMSYMFAGSSSPNLELKYLDTSKVQRMRAMFGVSSSRLDLSDFNTSEVIDMSHMFEGYQHTSLDLRGFDTRKVTNMEAMFAQSQLKQINLDYFDTTNVESMRWMFGAIPIENLNLNSFNTTNVTNMHAMFAGTELLKELDLSSFDTNNAVDMLRIFENTGIETIVSRTQADIDRFELAIENSTIKPKFDITFSIK